MKRKLTEQEKTFTWQETNRQNLLGAEKLHTQRTSVPMKKWANELNRNFSKEKVQMAKNRWRNARRYWL
jgi:hypothetical protein